MIGYKRSRHYEKAEDATITHSVVDEGVKYIIIIIKDFLQ